MKTLARIALVTLFIAIVAIRLYPVIANTAASYWHDENNYIEQALRLGSGGAQLYTFVHGGLFYIILFLEYSVYYLVGLLAGLFSSPLGLYLRYIGDPTVFFLIARVTVALFSAATACIVYPITLQIFKCQRVAFVATLFSAFSLFMVQMSFFALADFPAVFILLSSFLALVISVRDRDNAGTYYLSAFLVGLAVSCKYHTVFGVVPVYMAAIMRSGGIRTNMKESFRRVFLASIFIFIGFCAGMPFFLFNAAKLFRESFINLGVEYIIKNPNKMTWLFYFTNHLRNGLGLPLEILAICGIAYALYRHTKWDILLASFPIAYYLLFMHSMGFAYHCLPAIPFLMILAARFLDVLCKRLSKGFVPAAYLCCAVVIALPTAVDSARFMEYVASPDTRVEAKRWIEANLPSGAKVLGEGYLATLAVHSPGIIGNVETLKRDLAQVLSKGGSGFSIRTKIANFDKLYGGMRSFDIYKVEQMSPDDVARVRPAYIILTGDNDNITGAELNYYAPKDHAAKRRQLRDAILKDYYLIKSIRPTEEMTAWFPNFVDQDYALLRKSPLSRMRNYVRGPRIDVFMARGRPLSHG